MKNLKIHMSNNLNILNNDELLTKQSTTNVKNIRRLR